MRFWRDTAKDGAVLKNISGIAMETGRSLHGGFWHPVGMDFSVSDIDKVLQLAGQCFEEHAYWRAIRISKDARVVNVWRDVARVITDFQR